MKFEQAKPFLKIGIPARREAWGKSAQIQFREGEKFATLTSVFPTKAWQPYWEDFYATDWTVLGCTTAVYLRALLRRIMREASAID